MECNVEHLESIKVKKALGTKMFPNSEQHTSKICLHSSETTSYSSMQFSHILQFGH